MSVSLGGDSDGCLKHRRVNRQFPVAGDLLVASSGPLCAQLVFGAISKRFLRQARRFFFVSSAVLRCSYRHLRALLRRRGASAFGSQARG